eukprot:Em0016g858a
MEEKGNTTMATRGSCPLTSRQGTSLPSERAPQTHRKRLEDDDIIMSEVELDKDMFQKVLVEIGDHIQECIKSYGDGVMEKPQKLYKIYKKARKERGKEDMPVKRHYLESSEQGSSQHSTSNLKNSREKCPPAAHTQPKGSLPSCLTSKGSNHSSQHRQTCNERGWSCIPLVVEAYGGWGQEAVSMFARLSKLLSLHQRQSFSAALNELYCHLSVVLMRQNAQALLAHAAGAR